MTLEEQLAYFDRKAEQAYVRHLRRLKDADYKAQVLGEARLRLIEGFPLYGDAMFRKEHVALLDDERQEDADAINFRLARMWNGWPT